MARTAPIPNIPAIPGMNPGIWILGGGASGQGEDAEPPLGRAAPKPKGSDLR
jgi:hypothetical protein